RILERDGYSKGQDGYFQKGGQQLSVQWSVITGNLRRQKTQTLEIEKARLAGIHLVARSYPAGQFWENVLTGKFGLAEAGFIVGPDPSVESSFGCDHFPTEANDFSAGNGIRWCNPEATDLMKQADRELDPTTRVK